MLLAYFLLGPAVLAGDKIDSGEISKIKMPRPFPGRLDHNKDNVHREPYDDPANPLSTERFRFCASQALLLGLKDVIKIEATQDFRCGEAYHRTLADVDLWNWSTRGGADVFLMTKDVPSPVLGESPVKRSNETEEMIQALKDHEENLEELEEKLNDRRETILAFNAHADTVLARADELKRFVAKQYKNIALDQEELHNAQQAYYEHLNETLAMEKQVVYQFTDDWIQTPSETELVDAIERFEWAMDHLRENEGKERQRYKKMLEDEEAASKPINRTLPKLPGHIRDKLLRFVQPIPISKLPLGTIPKRIEHYIKCVEKNSGVQRRAIETQGLFEKVRGFLHWSAKLYKKTVLPVIEAIAEEWEEECGEDEESI